MTLAVKILDRALREDFGFSCLLWVYSGRRGVHLWVCDQQARRLNTAARGAVAEYLQLVQGGEHKTKKIQLKGGFSPHPSVSRAYSIVKEDFEKLCLIDQDILGNKEAWTKVNRFSIWVHKVSVFLKVLALIPDYELRAACEKKMESCKNSVDRWNTIFVIHKQFIDNKDDKKRKSVEHLKIEIVLQMAYPR